MHLRPEGLLHTSSDQEDHCTLLRQGGPVDTSSRPGRLLHTSLQIRRPTTHFLRKGGPVHTYSTQGRLLHTSPQIRRNSEHFSDQEDQWTLLLRSVGPVHTSSDQCTLLLRPWRPVVQDQDHCTLHPSPGGPLVTAPQCRSSSADSTAPRPRSSVGAGLCSACPCDPTQAV